MAQKCCGSPLSHRRGVHEINGRLFNRSIGWPEADSAKNRSKEKAKKIVMAREFPVPYFAPGIGIFTKIFITIY
jgi:hypothetical protein